MYSDIENIADPRELERIADTPDVKNDYREASLRYLQIITVAMDFITSNSSRAVASYAVSYALGLDSICQGMSVSDRAALLGVTPAALSKQIRIFVDLAQISESAYSYRK